MDGSYRTQLSGGGGYYGGGSAMGDRMSAFLRESEMDGMYNSAMDSETERNNAANAEDGSKPAIARGERRAVSRMRIGFLLFFFVVAVVASVTSYILLRNNEKSTFETEYYEHAGRLVLGIQSSQRTKSIQAFAETITSHARFHNDSWPMVTLPDFEIQAGATAAAADLISMMLIPIVDESNREQWETYSVEHQSWLKEGLAVQERTMSSSRRRELQGAATGGGSGSSSGSPSSGSEGGGAAGQQNKDLSIPEFVHRIEGFSPVPDKGPGPYLPIWQLYPALEVPELVNFNILSHLGFRDTAISVLKTQSSIVSRSFEFTDTADDPLSASRRGIFYIFLRKWDRQEEYQDDPIADLYWPIFDSFDDTANGKLVAMLHGVVYWRLYFENILGDDIVLDAVLENSCNQAFTYQIDGPNVRYIGSGDLHDKTFDNFVIPMPSGSILGGDYVNQGGAQPQEGSCLYTVKIYPTEALQEVYVSSGPTVAMIILISVFLFTSCVMVIYDWLVERRQRVVMDAAMANTAIVSSLFPQNVRHRLYHPSEISEELVVKAHEVDTVNGDQKETPPTKTHKTKPIADLFENCTVLFADIVGFTSFCDGREPTDVFTLLETLYGKFDEIANKRSVFKVETIGDCYLAVTGLPTPQKDHAIIMSLFAHECMKTMKLLLVQDLRTALGSDVSSLGMRFGLHSGPVTAGVLRGEKSRFQLFGDTVNTAARMESTGARNKIQASQDTADTLIESGKAHWLLKRPDSVLAKGKGELVTYWVQPRSFRQDTDQMRAESMLAEVLTRKAARGDGPLLENNTDDMGQANTTTDRGESLTGAKARSVDMTGNPQDATLPSEQD